MLNSVVPAFPRSAWRFFDVTMSIIADYNLAEARIRAAIASAMETDVADAAKATIADNLGGYGFPFSRGEHGGGLLDPRSLETTIDTAGDEITLTIRDAAPFQGSTPQRDSTLAEVVIAGDPAFNMPRPRPFIDEAQVELDTGRAEQALIQGLRSRGITIK